MRPKDLRFLVEIDAKKPQLVFVQDETYFVMTSMDDDERGNFFAISNWETEQVLLETDKLDGLSFHPRDLRVFKWIREESYRESRIRAVCYVLVAQKQMMLEKVGREIHFRAWREYGSGLRRSSQPKPRSRVPLPSVQRAERVNPTQEYDYYEKKKAWLESGAAYGAMEVVAKPNMKPQSPGMVRVCNRCGAKVSLRKWNRHDSSRCPKLNLNA